MNAPELKIKQVLFIYKTPSPLLPLSPPKIIQLMLLVGSQRRCAKNRGVSRARFQNYFPQSLTLAPHPSLSLPVSLPRTHSPFSGSPLRARYTTHSRLSWLLNLFCHMGRDAVPYHHTNMQNIKKPCWLKYIRFYRFVHLRMDNLKITV